MPKRCILIISFQFLGFISFGQHCPWDGSSMIMLDIKKDPSQKIKKIYLVDSAGAVVMSKHYFPDKTEMDSAVFWKNPASPRKGKEEKWPSRYYAFAKDYEILALGGHDQPFPYSVMIVYTANGKPMQKDIPLLSNHIHQLCTLNKELWSGNVKPMSVIL